MKLTLQSHKDGAMHVTVDLQTGTDFGLQGWLLMPHQPGLTVEDLQVKALLKLSQILSTAAHEIRKSE